MTCIAWDGKTLAADKRVSFGGLIRTVTKIHKAGGCLVGGSGDASFIGSMVEWVAGGRDPKAFPDSQRHKDDWQPFMVIERPDKVLIYERTPHPIHWHDATAAIGSGRDFALAAMHLGECAADAVAVATLFDSGCGNGCDTLEFD